MLYLEAPDKVFKICLFGVKLALKLIVVRAC